MAFKKQLKRRLTLSSMAILSGILLANSQIVQAEETTPNSDDISVLNTGEATFHIDDIIEGNNVITGTAPFNGSVYAFVNGQIATEKAEIVDGKFELVFLPELEERHYLTTDSVYLSFMVDGKPSFMIQHTVLPANEGGGNEGTENTNTLYIPELTSTETHFFGVGPADHQILLYHYDSLAFVQEALIDENGNYSLTLPNLVSGDKYFLLHRTTSNEYGNILLLTVDKEQFTVVGQPYHQLVLKQLGLQDHSDWSDEGDDIALGVGLTKDTNAILGYTKHLDKTAIYITSSNPDKVFPLVPIDSLGYWGINLTELDWALEAGEELTFSVVNTETGEVYGQVTDTVTQINEGLELEEYTFDTEVLKAGTNSIEGQVAPNLTVVLYDGEGEEPLAKVTSDDKGFFKITLTKPLITEEILYLSAFDDKGTQIAWKALNVEESDDEVDTNDITTTELVGNKEDQKPSEPEKTKSDEALKTDNSPELVPEQPRTPIVTPEKEDTAPTNTDVTDTNKDQTNNTSTPSTSEKEEVEIDNPISNQPIETQPEESFPNTNTDVTVTPNTESNETVATNQNDYEEKNEEITPSPLQPVTPTENTLTPPKSTTPVNHSDSDQESKAPQNYLLEPLVSDNQSNETKEMVSNKQSEHTKLATPVSNKVVSSEKSTQKTLPKTSDSTSLLAMILGLFILLFVPFKAWKKK